MLVNLTYINGIYTLHRREGDIMKGAYGDATGILMIILPIELYSWVQPEAHNSL
jgi:hypothetical protein